MELKRSRKEIRFIGEPLAEGGEEDRWNVGVVGGDVDEEGVDQVTKTRVATRASREKDDVDGKGVEWRVDLAEGSGGLWGRGSLNEDDGGVRVAVVVGDELGGRRRRVGGRLVHGAQGCRVTR